MSIRLAGAAVWISVSALPALAKPGRRGGGGGGVDVSLTRVVMALLLGIMLAVLIALLLRRGGGRIDLTAIRRLFVALPAARRIQVIESRRVSPHADLCLVRCDAEEFFILSSAQQQQILRARAAEGYAAQPAADPENAA
jgi:hypothetical protein